MARSKKTDNINKTTSGRKKTISSTSSSTPNIKPLDFKFKVNEFAVRGLNKYKNFLTAPECDCGCGEKGRPMFETIDDLHNFCGSILYENGCGNSAIFLVFKNGKQEVLHCHEIWDEKDNESLIVSVISPKKGFQLDNDFFAAFDADMILHCYGLLIEKDDNCWEICE